MRQQSAAGYSQPATGLLDPERHSLAKRRDHMSIRDYYHRTFASDVSALVGEGVPFGDDVRHYFGHTWGIDCRGLDRVPKERQPDFLVCMYFTILVDQAIYTHYQGNYETFRRLTRYPKFCFGLGQFNLNPCGILSAPITQNLVEAAAVETLYMMGIGKGQAAIRILIAAGGLNVGIILLSIGVILFSISLPSKRLRLKAEDRRVLSDKIIQDMLNQK